MGKWILIPDSFKGTMSSEEICTVMAAALRRHLPEADIVSVPVADGGEGSVDAFLTALGGRREEVPCTGPDGRPITAFYGRLPDGTAVVEMAAAAGLPLMEGHLCAEGATTYGVGELLRAAVHAGAKRVILGLGGSATNDGGVGMLQALGCHFYKKDGIEIGFGATELKDLETIDTEVLDKRLKECTFEIACDVTNSLCGTTGASAVFAPQKGADETMVVKLDAALAHFADVTEKALGVDNRNMPGAGAAGGLGFAFASYLGGDLRPGVEIVLDAVLPEKELSEADIVVTGEGRFDGQTAMGKAPVGIAKRVKEKGCMVLVFAGSIEPQGVRKVQDEMQLVDGAFPILPGVMTLEEAMQKTVAYENMSYTAEQVFRLIGNCYIK